MTYRYPRIVCVLSRDVTAAWLSAVECAHERSNAPHPIREQNFMCYVAVVMSARVRVHSLVPNMGRAKSPHT